MRPNHFFIVVAFAGVFFAQLVFAHINTDGLLRPDLTEDERKRVDNLTRPATSFDKPEAFEMMQGGAGTSLKLINRDSFSNPSQNLTFEQQSKFQIGNAFFRKTWVASPSSTLASDGLGPLFNLRACQSCHLKDGRSLAPADSGFIPDSMVFSLAIPPRNALEIKAVESRAILNVPEPVYGGQIQTSSVPPVRPEGRVRVLYERFPVRLGGGEAVFLRRPFYSVEGLGYGPLSKSVITSARVSPQVIGLGLLEAIHPNDIIAHSDPQDKNGDGISGRPSFVRDGETGRLVLGRFGHKASTESVLVQSAKAFLNDMGISNPLQKSDWGDCTKEQVECRRSPHGTQTSLGDTEAPDPILEFVDFYARHLAVPARRDVDSEEVLRGKRLFYESNCVSCHTPKYVTRKDTDLKEDSFQLIWPYTDLLLHDMGEGLADGMSAGDASGSEWRTPPLWGLGLVKTVSPDAGYLHDGRAKTLLEAILWHGGEAQKARDEVVSMTPEQRKDLIRFLESL